MVATRASRPQKKQWKREELKLKNSPSKPKTKPAKKSQSPTLITDSSSDKDSNSANNPILVDDNNNPLAEDGLIALF
jgi:hypothetical protein